MYLSLYHCLSLVSVSCVRLSTCFFIYCLSTRLFFLLCVCVEHLSESVSQSVCPSFCLDASDAVHLPTRLSVRLRGCVCLVRQLSMEAGYKEKLAGGW